MEYLDKLWPSIKDHKIKYLIYIPLSVLGIYWIAFIAGAFYALIESLL